MIKGMLFRWVFGLVSTAVSLGVGYYVYTHYFSNSSANPATPVPGVNADQVKDQIQNQINR
jgi:hypothetical protein